VSLRPSSLQMYSIHPLSAMSTFCCSSTCSTNDLAPLTSASNWLKRIVDGRPPIEKCRCKFFLLLSPSSTAMHRNDRPYCSAARFPNTCKAVSAGLNASASLSIAFRRATECKQTATFAESLFGRRILHAIARNG